MSMIPPAAQRLGNASAAKPDLAATVKHVAGLLWYEMLSELNKTGLDSQSLGTGGDDFQGMFLWNVAQNDFGKYDSALANAMLRQVGGTADIAPAEIQAPVSDFPAPVIMQAAQPGGMIAAAALSAAPETTQPAADVVTQAKNFAKAIWPQISAAAQALDVPPVAVLAQTALETGWGAATPGNNLFGIKAVDGESSTTQPTHEVVDGVLTSQTAAFRDYASTAASVSDYVGQIQSGFQNVVGQSTVGGFARALQQAGYATDTNYAAKIISISRSPLMSQVLQAVGGTEQGVAPVPQNIVTGTGAS
ncbi:MAG TPA: glucosaminidase domain-containing protein [Acidocella sp.]|nr:glucosaminidase domain-containing protein [Acidocella sp.]